MPSHVAERMNLFLKFRPLIKLASNNLLMTLWPYSKGIVIVDFAATLLNLPENSAPCCVSAISSLHVHTYKQLVAIHMDGKPI